MPQIDAYACTPLCSKQSSERGREICNDRCTPPWVLTPFHPNCCRELADPAAELCGDSQEDRSKCENSRVQRSDDSRVQIQKRKMGDSRGIVFRPL
eukprot:36307-Eustigmatos_ZCMA.PRE.1